MKICNCWSVEPNDTWLLVEAKRLGGGGTTGGGPGLPNATSGSDYRFGDIVCSPGGGKSGYDKRIDPNEVYKATQVAREKMVKLSAETGNEYAYQILRNKKTGQIEVGKMWGGTDRSVSPDWNYDNKNYDLLGFDHIHNSNQPLEPMDLNCIGYNTQLLEGENSVSGSGEFIMICTTIQKTNNKKENKTTIKTVTYALIEDRKKFNKWYNNSDNFNNLHFMWQMKSSKGEYIDLEDLFYNGDFDNAFREFQFRLKGSGVRYEKFK